MNHDLGLFRQHRHCLSQHHDQAPGLGIFRMLAAGSMAASDPPQSEVTDCHGRYIFHFSPPAQSPDSVTRSLSHTHTHLHLSAFARPHERFHAILEIPFQPLVDSSPRHTSLSCCAEVRQRPGGSRIRPEWLILILLVISVPLVGFYTYRRVEVCCLPLLLLQIPGQSWEKTSHVSFLCCTSAR